MTLPEWTPLRKPRRLGLWAPFILVLIGAVVWSMDWFWLRGEIERRMEAARTHVTGSGWTLDWRARRISGFPFRLDVDLDEPRAREPSGWGLAAPRLKAESFVFSPTHWIIVAPDGVTVGRRRGGPLIVTAKALRASVSDAAASPPRISVEGLGLTFNTPPGAPPYFLRSAAEFHLHTKAGPDDQGAIYIELDGAAPRMEGLVGRIANGRSASLIADAIYSKAHAFSGASWEASARSWSAAGGVMTLRHLHVTAGSAEIDSRVGALGIGKDGRVAGRVDLSLRQAPRTLDAMSAQGALAPETARAAATVAGALQQGAIARMPLSFQAGRTTLGPLSLGPAPRIY